MKKYIIYENRDERVCVRVCVCVCRASVYWCLPRENYSHS